MNIQRKRTDKASIFVRFGLAWVIFVFAVPASVSFGHQWTIGNKKVEATLTGFDGENVTLELANKRVRSIPVQQLNQADLNYVKTLMELSSIDQSRRNTDRQRTIELAQLQVLLGQYRSQWYELWVVQFVGPQGEYFYWAYPVRNSYQASLRAGYQFPNARIIGIRKLNRQW